MLIVGLTESSARFITGMIVVGIIALILGWLSMMTGINVFALLGVFVFAFALLILNLTGVLKKSNGSNGAPRNVATFATNRCTFIRANGKGCVLTRSKGSDYCEHHASKSSNIVVGEEDLTAEATLVKSPAKKRSQCGFVQDDGSKCRKLKPVEMRRCNYHLKLEEAAKEASA